jgi:tetratricopeptide (TPR) repeat protein
MTKILTSNNTIDKNFILIFIGFLLATIIMYWPTLFYDFIRSLDDDWLLINNPAVKDLSLKGIWYIFVEDKLEMHYHPLTYFSLAIDYHFFGENPLPMKVHNLILHLLSGGLIIVFLVQLGFNKWIALMTAGLFLIHPLHLESVVWPTSRRQVLLLFHSLLSMIAFNKSINSTSKSTFYFVLAMVFYALATLAKATAFIMPFIFILLAWYQYKWAGNKKLWLQMLLFIPLMIFFYKVNVAANDRNFLAREFSYEWWHHIFFTGYSYTWYWIKMIFPYPLSIFYPVMPENSSLPVTYIVYTIISFGLFAGTIYAWKNGHRLFLFIIFFYSITISMKLNRILLPPSDVPTLVGDRYFYLSCPVMLFAVSYLIFNMFRKKGVVIVFSLLFVWLFALAKIQTPQWESDYELLKNVAKFYPNEDFYQRLAIVQKREGDLSSAYQSLKKADELHTNIWIVSNWSFEFDKAQIYFLNGDYTNAIKTFQAAIDKGASLRPEVHFYLGISKMMISDTLGYEHLNKAFEIVASKKDYDGLRQILEQYENNLPEGFCFEVPKRNF